jgi:hypothetical protein
MLECEEKVSTKLPGQPKTFRFNTGRPKPIISGLLWIMNRRRIQNKDINDYRCINPFASKVKTMFRKPNQGTLGKPDST